MSSDDLTQQTPTDDRLDELISLVHGMSQKLRQELAELKQELKSTRSELAELRQEFNSTRSELTELKETVDSRLRDTRPIWEAVQAQLNTLSENVDKGFRRLDHKIELHAKNLVELYADHRELESRVDSLQKEPAS